ncbi:hypothetical protein ACM3CX_18295 (plasmid) [Edwardsiella ictaluri]|uniref:hypothetical protein n=1 Tax=Edwardsiella ictaluri TaxID=67780 RepID=UPI0039F6DEB1
MQQLIGVVGFAWQMLANGDRAGLVKPACTYGGLLCGHIHVLISSQGLRLRPRYRDIRQDCTRFRGRLFFCVPKYTQQQDLSIPQVFTITPARRTASDVLSAILRRYRQKTQLRTPKTAKIAQDDSGGVA